MHVAPAVGLNSARTDAACRSATTAAATGLSGRLGSAAAAAGAADTPQRCQRRRCRGGTPQYLFSLVIFSIVVVSHHFPLRVHYCCAALPGRKGSGCRTKNLFKTKFLTPTTTPNCFLAAPHSEVEKHERGLAGLLRPMAYGTVRCCCGSTGAGPTPGPAPLYSSVIKSLMDHTILSIKHKPGQSVPRACPSCPPSMTSTQISTFANNGSATPFTAKACA